MEVMQRKSAAAALEDKLNKAISRQEAAEAQAAAASAVFAGLSLSVSPNPLGSDPLAFSHADTHECTSHTDTRAPDTRASACTPH